MVTAKTNFNRYVFAVMMPVLTLLYMFRTDEGSYNFNWMLHSGSWIMFIVYTGALALGQYINLLISEHINERRRIAVNLIPGILLGVGFVILFFHLLKTALRMTSWS